MNPLPLLRLLGFSLLLGVTAAEAAEDWLWGGHASYQVGQYRYPSRSAQALNGSRWPRSHALHLRLRGEFQRGPWSAQWHYQVSALRSGVVGQRLEDVDPQRVADLDWTLAEGAEGAARHRLDRLLLGYSGERLSLRLGRQAVSWGNGLLFQPLDIFAPFAPTAWEREYKTGEDMLYAQWLFADGGDAQLIILPRRVPEGGGMRAEAGSLALKYHAERAGWGLDWVAARHAGDAVLGLGLAKDLGGAVWRADFSYNAGVWSAVTNLDYSWVWGGHNVYGYAEYYHSGFGLSDPAAYARPPGTLRARLQRGELFSLGRDYLGLGLRLELTPLLNLSLNALVNLRDPSGLWQLRLLYDAQQDRQWSLGLDLPWGGPGSEFGGPNLANGSHAAPGHRLSLEVKQYF